MMPNAIVASVDTPAAIPTEATTGEAACVIFVVPSIAMYSTRE